MIEVGTKVRVKEGAHIKDLYGLKVGDVITTCDAPEGLEKFDIWMNRFENLHVAYEGDWDFCETFCIATDQEQFHRDFEILEDK